MNQFIRKIKNAIEPKFDSIKYWEKRYKKGANSGIGSYGKFADFKAEVINNFLKNNQIDSVIEFGCGDGNQVSLINYPQYLGFDVSETVINTCCDKFTNDHTKTFKLISAYTNQVAQLTISLDVIYHLVEFDAYETYMNRLFESSHEFVLIYSSNTDETFSDTSLHVKHRKITHWIKINYPHWSLIKEIKNHLQNISTNFYIYKKTNTC